MNRFLLGAAALGLAAIAGGTALAAKESKTDAGQEGAEAAAVDPLFTEPYIDIDEWRDAPVRHRYVHGGFKGTETRFSFYFPPKDQYEGRFFQHITPVPISENLAQAEPVGAKNKIAFSIASGAYYVESNGGGALDLGKSKGVVDSDISAFRANAAVARYSRVVVEKIYKTDKRPYGYAYGGSGGAYRTIGGMESTTGVWDGAVPYVPGSTMAIPNMFTVRIQAMRILGDKLADVVDAVEPGGSGDPYAGLNAEETRALREITRMGFPTPSWFGYKTMGVHGFASLYQGILAVDPTYSTDFWTKPGYLGHDRPEIFAGARMQHETTIAGAITALEAAKLGLNTDAGREKAKDDAGRTKDKGNVDEAFKALQGDEGQRVVAFRVSEAPPADIPFLGGDLFVTSGKEAGKRVNIARIVGDIVVLGVADADIVKELAPGDEVRVDNSNFLAMESYHRHQVPGPEFKVWDQFRNPDGTPKYPQRPILIGPLFTKSTTGSGMTGKFKGKMIVAASLWDREAMPWQADWYRQQVKKNLGDATDDHFRLYYTDHALHGDYQKVEDANHVVSYIPVLQQSLRDLAAWVEDGVEPPSSTNYTIEDGQVIVPDNAKDRKGIQPVVTLTANGGERADVRVGEPVTFAGTIEVPPGTGSVVAAEWDFDGTGTFASSSPVGEGANRVSVSITHAFDKPGTYFTALRGMSQRQGDKETLYARIPNLGRVRVVVR